MLAVLSVLAVVLLVRPWGTGRPGADGAAGSPRPTTVATSAPDSPAARISTSASASPTLQVPVDPTTAGAAAGVPVRLVVPSIGVDTGLQHLGVLSDGTLQSPSAWQTAGWFDRGPRPGDTGPAVIAGHVDSVNGPAVFFHLRDLHAGAAVAVYDDAGRVHRFTVSAVAEYPKRSFPSQAVYGPSPLPVLRLVTCTGDFDYTAHSYVDNLVVTAVLNGRTIN